jgi:hypothetical protein
MKKLGLKSINFAAADAWATTATEAYVNITINFGSSAVFVA